MLLLLIAGTAQGQDIHLIPSSELPKLTVYRPQKNQSKAAVIICAGGAYAYRSDYGEGVVPAKRLNESGITAFLLDYRLPKGNDTIPLHDAQAAIQYLRKNYRQFHIDPHQVGITGFSAGGHLAATAGTHFKTPEERPDFMVLAYAVISMTDSLTHAWSRDNLLGKHPDSAAVRLYSNELKVTDQTPGTFITHAMDDPGVRYQNSLYFEAALLQHHVPVQLFLYAKGGHAYGVAVAGPKVQWIDAGIDWTNKEQWKKNEER
ncbi:MAG: alpha/beta hydrolase [Bacteroidetes bacterium]|nr:alpha/beta hydrolase [Bacteroidota bacterium]